MSVQKVEWRAVPDWEGWYEVSSDGQVRSLDRYVTARHPTGRVIPRFFRGRILRQNRSSQPYYIVQLSRPGRTEHYYVHDLVTSAFLGPKPEGFEVCHWDGDPANNLLENLRYDTRSANSADRHRHGTHGLIFGEACASAKLTEEDVRWIRAHEGSLSYREMGRRFGVSHKTASDAARRVQWRHVA